MANLAERLDRIEAALDAHDGGHVVYIALISSEADLRELPEEPQSWLTFPGREAGPPSIGTRIFHLDSHAERAARAEQAARN